MRFAVMEIFVRFNKLVLVNNMLIKPRPFNIPYTFSETPKGLYRKRQDLFPNFKARLSDWL